MEVFLSWSCDRGPSVPGWLQMVKERSMVGPCAVMQLEAK